MGRGSKPLDSMVDEDFNKQAMKNILVYRKMGETVPKTPEELKERIEQYFTYCDENGVRPGVESMTLACGVTRQGFLNWENGKYREDFMEICQLAKQSILSWLEQAAVSGKVNPVVFIFQAKCNHNYEEKSIVEHRTTDKLLSASDLPYLGSKNRFEEWKKKREEESKVIDAEFVEIRPVD